MLGQAQQPALPDGPQQQQAIPDAPRPQTSLPTQGVAPGKGATPETANPDIAPDQAAPGTSLPSSPAAVVGQTHPDDGPAPELPATGEGPGVFTVRTQTNFVQVPFTVKDSKGRLVPGLTWRDVRVYENGLRQQMDLFTVDPFPLSVALVIDQSVTFDTMKKINNSLAALQGAFAPYDEVAVFTYNNGPQLQHRLHRRPEPTPLRRPRAVQGRRPRAHLLRSARGPLGQNINVNNGAQQNIDPNTNSRHGTSMSNTINVPTEVHTLNDAILEAAKATARTGKDKSGRDRRRIVYVISDGKEYGSTAKEKDVIKYLQTNKIAVYATLVGDSSQSPASASSTASTCRSRCATTSCPVYTQATGGQIDRRVPPEGHRAELRPRSPKRSAPSTPSATTATSPSSTASTASSTSASCVPASPSSPRMATGPPQTTSGQPFARLSPTLPHPMHLLFRGNAALALAAAIIWGGGDFSGGVAVESAGGSLRSAFRVILSATPQLRHPPSPGRRSAAAPSPHTPPSPGDSPPASSPHSPSAPSTSPSPAVPWEPPPPSAACSPPPSRQPSPSPPKALPGLLRLLGFARRSHRHLAHRGRPAEPRPPPNRRPSRHPARQPPSHAARHRRRHRLRPLLHLAEDGQPRWPPLAHGRRPPRQLHSAALLVLATLRRPRTPASRPPSAYLPRKAVLWAMGPALLDTAGNLLFMASTRMGRLDVAAVLASLYPASTILLAAWMLHERPTRRQCLGMLTAAAAVVLITL